MAATTHSAAEVRLTVNMLGHFSRVEVKTQDGVWIDISSVVTAARADTRVGDLSEISLDVIKAEVVVDEARLSAEALEELASIVDEARARNVIAPPETQMVTVPIHIHGKELAEEIVTSVSRSLLARSRRLS